MCLKTAENLFHIYMYSYYAYQVKTKEKAGI